MKAPDDPRPGRPREHPTLVGADSGDTTCPRCGEFRELAKVKGCVKCLSCGFKFDCNGW